MSFYTENIRILEKKYPAFTSDITAHYIPDSTITGITSSSGHPTCEYNGRLLHSRHDPVREAGRLIEQEVREEPDCCVFAGFGLGYQVEAFLEKYGDAPAVIFEPDIPFFLKVLELRDFTGMLAKENISLFLGVDPSEVVLFLSAIRARVVHLHILRPAAETHGEIFQKLENGVHAHISKNEINKNTLNRFGKLWVRNLLKNLDLLRDTQGVKRLKAAFQDCPSLILAGGPSLDSVLPFLAELRKRFLIVAVDTSLRASLSAGVEPDFLIVVDPQYWNSRHLDNCSTLETMLISESSTYPAIFRLFGGQVFFCSSLFPLGQFLESDIGIKGELGAGGSVSTTAWDFCRYIGSAPIVCAGLDLGYPDMTTHFKGSFFEERALAMADRRCTAETANFSYVYEAAPFPAVNNQGGKTLTDKRMTLYRQWFESQLAQHSSGTSHTVSPKGLKIQGMAYRDQKELLDFPVIRDTLDSSLDAIRKEKKTENRNRKEQVTYSLKALILQLENLRRLARRGAERAGELEKLFLRGAPFANVLDDLAAVDAAISASPIRDIAGFLIYDLSTDIVTRKPKTPEETLKKSKQLYEEMTNSIMYHLNLLRRREC